jgi:exopolyphosphatase/guanosine-5'-triphosphate,3'-diphosphate pyrophosphatase
MRLAAVDIGSNTVHVLVADAAPEGLRDVAHYVEMPELGAAVARTGEIGEAKAAEALAALHSVLTKAAAHGYEKLVAGATAAVRKAADGAALLERASAEAGVSVRLISGEREAQLSFLGVASRHAARHDWLMCDLGGGSTELVAAYNRQMGSWVSLDLGSGALAARFLSDPPAAAERASLRETAVQALRKAPDCAPEKLVATGGTATNLPTLLSTDSPPSVLTADALLEVQRRLDDEPAAAIARRSGLGEGRVRALRGGVEILLLLLDYYGLQALHVSHEGLRHGMLLAYLEQGDDWWHVP